MGIKTSTLKEFRLKNSIRNSIFIYSTLSLLSFNSMYGQYIHPNQAGRKGGNTTQAGKGNYVIVSTEKVMHLL